MHLALWLAATPLHLSSAQAQPAAETIPALAIDFQRDVLPILEEHCLHCHGSDENEANLRLDSLVLALRGGDSGEKTIVPGDSDHSYLIERVLHERADQRMPPESEPLADDHIALLRAWIDQPDLWLDAQRELDEQPLDHWSFQPLVRPTLPQVIDSEDTQPTPTAERRATLKTEAERRATLKTDAERRATLKTKAEWASQPIDAFILNKLHDSGLSPSPIAERRWLIRRLYLVMLGLPPTPEQLDAFVNDPRPDAWQQLVNSVLDSPHYGERWAQHWLDLVRFGETDGFETNRERPNAWRYRDWVIAALNADKPYNQFIMEQIAGDALDQPLGTSFLVGGPVDIVKGQNPELEQMQRQDELADIINTTSTTFLGLTVGCARCHNHKFDPISQADYYSMQALLAGVRHGETTLPRATAIAQAISQLDQTSSQLEQQLEPYLVEPELRAPVTAQRNEERFTPVETQWVRFTIQATNGSQPCLDELEIFASASDRNVGLASSGATASSSGDFAHPFHKLAHINDGLFGNPHSWIAEETSGSWVQLALPHATSIDRIVWARDRAGEYADRIPTKYSIVVSSDALQWTEVASSRDRQPYNAATAASSDTVVYDFSKCSPEQAAAARAKLQQLTELREHRAQLSQPVSAYAGSFAQPGPTYRLYRGEPGAPREQVAPAGIAALEPQQLALDLPEQQRRLWLAQWIADERNPLTPRVMANRLWQFHFGTGIVDTPSDLGGNGTPPSHPELLDWLACELIDSGWSLKHLHRLILNSQTWQQDSHPREDGLSLDAASRWLWRFPPRRLEAEAIRDCMLSVSGQLDLRSGGPGFSAFDVSLENVRHYFPKQSYGPDDWRRMVYMTKVRQERDSVFGVFDCPDASQVTPQRNRSTTPLQALNLFNSRFVNQQSDLLAQRLQRAQPLDSQRVALAYSLCFGRPPLPEEQASATEFIQQFGWPPFTRALLNSNEFVFIP